MAIIVYLIYGPKTRAEGLAIFELTDLWKEERRWKNGDQVTAHSSQVIG
jgi:hypothetical protein